MIIPAIKTEGVFTFSSPFDKDEINNKYYTVVGIRMLRDLFKNEEDPLNSIYLQSGMSEEDFNSDLENDVPIISLSSQGTRQIYIPANKIIGMPKLSGVKYQKKIININLGLIPQDLNLDHVVDNIKDVVMDALGIIPTTKVSTHSSSFLKTEEEHDKFMNFLSSHPTARSFKSYKQQFISCDKQLTELRKTHNEIVGFMAKTWENNVNFITDIPTQVQQVMTKKIIIDCVSSSKDKSFILNDLGFKICSPIGNVRTSIYGKGFMPKDLTGRTSFYGMLSNTPMSITVKEGSILSSHLPDIFSTRGTVTFFPFLKSSDEGETHKTSRCTIEIELDSPLYITDFTARVYHTSDSHMSKFRVILYNNLDKIVFNTTYELNRDFNAANTLLEKNIKEALQIRGDIPHPLPDPS